MGAAPQASRLASKPALLRRPAHAAQSRLRLSAGVRRCGTAQEPYCGLATQRTSRGAGRTGACCAGAVHHHGAAMQKLAAFVVPALLIAAAATPCRAKDEVRTPTGTIAAASATSRSNFTAAMRARCSTTRISARQQRRARARPGAPTRRLHAFAHHAVARAGATCSTSPCSPTRDSRTRCASRRPFRRGARFTRSLERHYFIRGLNRRSRRASPGSKPLPTVFYSDLPTPTGRSDDLCTNFHEARAVVCHRCARRVDVFQMPPRAPPAAGDGRPAS